MELPPPVVQTLIFQTWLGAKGNLCEGDAYAEFSVAHGFMDSRMSMSTLYWRNPPRARRLMKMEARWRRMNKQLFVAVHMWLISS
jgi:hypothetical protein